MPPNGEVVDGQLRPQRPDPSIYEAAIESLRNNKHITNMAFHDEDYRVRMRQIQATYKVQLQQKPWAQKGYVFRNRLIWDHDRLWGTFELGFIKGLFLIDPGPGQNHFQADDKLNQQESVNGTPSHSKGGEKTETASSRQYPLVWRGRSPVMPGKLFNSPLTIGKIRFGHGKIWGHFEGMLGFNFPRGCCEFHGKVPVGPALVALSLQNVIDDWNDHDIHSDDEEPRSLTPDSDSSKDEGSNSITTSSSSESSDGLNEEDQEKFWDQITGCFDITSGAIENNWHGMSHGLTIRIHVDKEEEQTWGQFDFGMADGYLLFKVPPGEIEYNIPMAFRWRGRENRTRSHLKGDGEVTICEDETVQGIFRGMEDNVDFRGRKRCTPSVSGYGADYYRQGWDDYAHSADPDFYSGRREWYEKRALVKDTQKLS